MEKKRKYVLYGHDGSANHGCEALVRSTAELLDHKHNKVILVSRRPQEDTAYGLDTICDIRHSDIREQNIKKRWGFFKAYYALKIKHDYFPMDALAAAEALGIDQDDIALSIGGDTYCYNDYMRQKLFCQNRIFRLRKMKTVLWGCSFESDLLQDQRVEEEIGLYDLITARETLSYKILKEVNKNTILAADSAFNLEEVLLPMPAGFEKGNVVGINSSPLIERREQSPGCVRRNLEKLIETILIESDYKILLIPHVIWATDDDRTVLQPLYEKFKDSGRVAMIEDHNCMELKGYISRCRFFIGARTHAAIAAYSTCVPTLALGYSTKSRGIAMDLFGNTENYVLPVQELDGESCLVKKWEWIHNNEELIRNKLLHIIPEYKCRIVAGVNALQKL